MDDDTENKPAETAEDTGEAEKIEEDFEILTMESDESKAGLGDSNLYDDVKKGEDDLDDFMKDGYSETQTSELVEANDVENTSELPEESKEKQDCSDSNEQEENNIDDNSWNWNTWTNWGTSVINTAANSVTTFTSQVGDGLIQVLETVESGFVAQGEEDEKKVLPVDPIEDQPMKEQENMAETEPQETSPGIGSGIASGKSWLFSSLSNVVNKTTSVVQQTTNVVVHGGLDMLETIGKKTYDVITEGDHGLKRVLERNKETRQMPNLSLVLKEAREISDLKFREEETLLESKKFLYSYWFDEYQGLVQLEAFELLANQNESWSRKEYDRLPRARLAVVKKRLAELNEIYKTVDEDNEDEEVDDKQVFSQLLLDYAAKLPVNISVQNLLECQESCRNWLDQHENLNLDEGDKDLSPKEVLKKSMQFLAQLTTLSIQHFHKLAQLIIKTSSIPDTPADGSNFPGVSVTETARNIVEFSKVLCREFSVVSGKFATSLGRFESSEGTDAEISMEISEHITTVYLEASNSSNFVQRSLKLLLPALQVAAMNNQ